MNLLHLKNYRINYSRCVHVHTETTYTQRDMYCIESVPLLQILRLRVHTVFTIYFSTSPFSPPLPASLSFLSFVGFVDGGGDKKNNDNRDADDTEYFQRVRTLLYNMQNDTRRTYLWRTCARPFKNGSWYEFRTTLGVFAFGLGWIRASWSSIRHNAEFYAA